MDMHPPPKGLDTIDLRLIDALIAHGRMSNTKLARLIGIAEPTCTKRRQRLEKIGVILGYTAIVAHERARSSFRAWCSARLVNSGAAVSAVFEQILKNEPSVATVFATGVHADFMFEVRTESFDSARALKARLEMRDDIVAELQMSPIFKQA